MNLFLCFLILIIGLILLIFLAMSSPILFYWMLGFIGIATIVITFVVILVSLGIVKPAKNFTRNIIKSKKSAQFQEIFNHIQIEYGTKLEILRKQLKGRLILSVFLVLTCVFLPHLVSQLLHSNFYILLIMIFPAIFYGVRNYNKYHTLYKKYYKDIVIKSFIENINTNLRYTYEGYEDAKSYYLDASFPDKEYNTFYTTDYIEGYVNRNIPLQLCNVYLQNRKTDNTIINRIYNGIFSFTFLSNYMVDELRIKKNKRKITNQNNFENLDYSEFQKYFDVSCTSQSLAMKILTPAIMKELITFYLQYTICFEIVMKKKQLYIRFDTGTMFEPNILRKSLTPNTLWVYYNVLEFVILFSAKLYQMIRDSES